MSETTLHQFDIVEAALWPTRGSEQSGQRPCLVLLTNGVKQEGRLTILAPFSTQLKKVYPYELLVQPTTGNGLRKTSKLKLEQLRVADKSRIKKHLGKLEESYYYTVYQALSLILDLRGDYL